AEAKLKASDSPHKAGQAKPPGNDKIDLRGYLGVFRYSKRAIELVWSTNKVLTIGLALGSLIAGLLPTGIAYVGKRLVDSIILAASTRAVADRIVAVEWGVAEPGLVVAPALVSRTLGIFRSLLRQQLGQKINVVILEKALTLELSQ